MCVWIRENITSALERSEVMLAMSSSQQEGGREEGGGESVRKWSLDCAVWAFSTPRGQKPGSLYVSRYMYV